MNTAAVPSLPRLSRRRSKDTTAEAAAGRPGPTVSIPVLTGLCRITDTALMVVSSCVAGLLFRRIYPDAPWGEFLVVSAIAVVAARMVAEWQGSYTLAALLNPFGHLWRLAVCLLAGASVSAGALFLLHGMPADLVIVGRQPVAWALASGATLLAFRAAAAVQLNAHAAAGRLSTRVALVGANPSSMQFIRDAEGDDRLTIVGIYDDRATRLPVEAARTWNRGNIDALIALARTQPVDAIVIGLPSDSAGRIDDISERLSGLAADVFVTIDAAALARPGAAFTMLGPNPVLTIANAPLKDWMAFRKTTFDRVASVCLLVLGLPLMALIAVLVKLNLPGPVLFRQQREGLNGEPFTMLKFRTMHHRPDAGPLVQATQQDRRVTRTGYWLRRFSLDELPQLWNVLRGDMSLVGPRPHYASTRAGTRLFSEVVPHYQARHRMKPGMTGWAQVQGLRGETRTEQDLLDRVKQDLYYIENWSFGLDIRIILRTIFRELIVSSSGRAY